MRVPDVRTVEVALPDLPRGLEGFVVVQISDLHVGPVLKKAWLESVVGRVNALGADLVLITGDMVDGRVDEIGPDLLPLAKLSARHGVFGVTGNHEYFYDARAWTSFFEALGVTMLANGHRVVSVGGAQLVVAGVPDHRAGKFGEGFPDAGLAFKGAPAGVPRLLMSHRPGETAESEGFDLQLSGHTHGGSLFFAAPMIAKLNGGFVRGLYRVGEKQVYVSPGTGIWNGFSCRLGVPSEITRILLRAEPEDKKRPG